MWFILPAKGFDTVSACPVSFAFWPYRFTLPPQTSAIPKPEPYLSYHSARNQLEANSNEEVEMAHYDAVQLNRMNTMVIAKYSLVLLLRDVNEGYLIADFKWSSTLWRISEAT